MAFAAGDKVKYLNDIGGGTVVGYVENGVVEIRDENGFEIPVLESELVLAGKRELSPAQPRPAEQQALPITAAVQAPTTQDTPEIDGNDTPRLFIAFVPDEGNVLADKFSVYLINDCNYHLLYTVHEKVMANMRIADAGAAAANTKMLLYKAGKAELGKLSTLFVQGVYYKSRQSGVLAPVQADLKFNPVKLSKPGSFKENDFFSQPALVIELTNDKMREAAENIDFSVLADIAKADTARAAQPQKPLRDDLREIDLHSHEVLETEAGLAPGDILEAQIAKFKSEMERAIVDKQQRVVFIHGVGQGVLKMKIRSILDRDYKKCRYQDASFAKYKFGATMVDL
jgi:hypothetical protein